MRRLSTALSATVFVASLVLEGAAALARCPDTPPFVSDATIRFDAGSAALRPADVREIQEMAARAAMRRVGQICVYGSTERGEDQAGTSNLAIDRAEAVADELRHAGFPSSRIEVIPVSGGDGFLGAMAGSGATAEIVLEP